MYPIKTLAPYHPDFLEKLGNIYTTVYLGNYVAWDYEEGSGSHPGVDMIPMTVNDSVCAVLAGQVLVSQSNPSEGNYIVIRHDGVKNNDTGKVGTYYSCYLHLSELSVVKDQIVAEGDIIGKTGSTGQSTGEHLHFQIDTAEAPFHPYWPFSFKEARDLNLGFMEAVNKWLGIENARKYTVNPLMFLGEVSSGAIAVKKPVTPVVEKPPVVVNTISTSVVTNDKNLASTTSAWSMPFADILPSNRFLEAISYLKHEGIISGQGGNYLPKSNVTRGELLKMVLLAGKLRLADSRTSQFSDVPLESSFLTYVNTAVALKAVSGYPDGTFRPNNSVTRAEGLKIVLGVMQVPLDTVDGPVYMDVSKSDWFAPQALWNRDHDILPAKNSNFLPNSLLTREEIAGIIFEAVKNK